MARKSTKSRAASPADVVIDATMAAIAERGWHRTTLSDIAEASGVGLGEMRRLFGGKSDIMVHFIRRIDADVLAGPISFSDEDGPRDRLFDLLMRRFDALSAYKEALTRLRSDLGGDPVALACIAPCAKRAMRWYLDAAGVGASGPFGGLRADGLLLVWLASARVWFGDDSEDMGKTMAALDKNLMRAECGALWLKRLERGCGNLCRRATGPRTGGAADEAADAAGAA